MHSFLYDFQILLNKWWADFFENNLNPHYVSRTWIPHIYFTKNPNPKLSNFLKKVRSTYESFSNFLEPIIIVSPLLLTYWSNHINIICRKLLILTFSSSFSRSKDNVAPSASTIIILSPYAASIPFHIYDWFQYINYGHNTIRRAPPFPLFFLYQAIFQLIGLANFMKKSFVT